MQVTTRQSAFDLQPRQTQPNPQQQASRCTETYIMATQVVYDDVAEGAELGGQLFAGKKFWIAQRTPMRNHYVELVKSNGGKVVPLERQADFLIADHARKDTPPGSLSYRFIEKSVENGEIENPDAYPAGPAPGVQRDAGSSRPTKGIRTPFSAEDDRLLGDWVRDFARQGGAVSGNEIYKQLESVVCQPSMHIFI